MVCYIAHEEKKGKIYNCMVTDYLDDTVAKFPNKTAFADEMHTLTFGEVKETAQKIASTA